MVESQCQIVVAIINDISFEKDSNSLVILLGESEKGYLQIVMPSNLLHSPRQTLFIYFVTTDDKQVDFEKITPILLKIPFEKGTKQIRIM